MEKKIYYRRRYDKFIIEMERDGMATYVLTLPEPLRLLNMMIESRHFLFKEQVEHIKSKLNEYLKEESEEHIQYLIKHYSEEKVKYPTLFKEWVDGWEAEPNKESDGYKLFRRIFEAIK